MGTPNIIQTRVDERLLHGQASLWMQSNGCNLVVVADDDSSKNQLQQDLMNTTVPDGVGSRFFTLEKTISVIHNAAPTQKIFIIVKSIKNLKTLIDGGVPIKEINVGNVHKTDGKTQITSHIYLSQGEKDILRGFLNKGIKINTSIMPNISKGKIDIEKVV